MAIKRKKAVPHSEALFVHDLVNIITAMSLTFGELKGVPSKVSLEEKKNFQNLTALMRRLEIHVGKKLL